MNSRVAYYLVGRQNTLPLYMFGAMNSGASPTIYAFSGLVLLVAHVIEFDGIV
jgi:spermidine/putrescine transport system permease protein